MTKPSAMRCCCRRRAARRLARGAPRRPTNAAASSAGCAAASLRRRAARARLRARAPSAFLGSAHIAAGELIPDRLLSPLEVQGLLALLNLPDLIEPIP
jgi:hypothetical protein